MKKVLFYAPLIGRGGIANLAQKLCKSLAKFAEVHVLSAIHDEFGNPLVWEGAQSITRLTPEHPMHPALFEFMTTHMPDFHVQLKALVRALQPDVIYLPMGWWTMRGVAQWDIRIPTYAFIADFAMDYLPEFKENPFFTLYRREAFQLAQHCAGLIVPSRFQRALAKEYGFKDIIAVYHSAFIPEGFNPNRSEGERVRLKYKLPSNYMLAFHAANHKDPVTLIKGVHNARIMSDAVPPLVIAGLETEQLRPHAHTGSAFAMLAQETIERSSVDWAKEFYILGEVPTADIAGLYANASAVITATRSEGGLPGTVCEAGAAQIPLIHSNFPVLTERISQEMGYVFAIGDVIGCARAIVRRYMDEQTARNKALNFHAFLSSNDWNDTCLLYTSPSPRD